MQNPFLFMQHNKHLDKVVKIRDYQINKATKCFCVAFYKH